MHQFLWLRNAQKYTAYKYLPLIMLDYVSRINNKYYIQTFLEECKYKIKNYKMKCNMNYDFHTSSSDESDNEHDSESDNEFDNGESEKPSKKSDIESEKSSKKMKLIVKLINLLMNLKTKLYFNNNKSLILYVNHALLGISLC